MTENGSRPGPAQPGGSPGAARSVADKAPAALTPTALNPTALNHGAALLQPAASYRRERGIWYAFAFALVLHGLLLLSIVRAAPRQIGAPGGSLDGVSVELIDAADLASREVVALQSAPTPTPSGAAGQPPSPQTLPVPAPTSAATPPPTPAKQPDRQPETLPETLPETPPEPPQDTPRAADQQQDADAGPASDLRKTLPDKAQDRQPPAPEPKAVDQRFADLMTLPVPQASLNAKSAKSERQKKRASPSERRKPAPTFDLSIPSSAQSAQPAIQFGRSAGFARPPGITRSGANDDFARGVIRALRQTMPQLADTHGRVTVKLVLNENGNLAKVDLIRSSGIRALDQSVMFATRQSNFPLPPARSLKVDRIFLVTYIYR